MTGEYEVVIGLEIHCELKTKTKIFCSCPTDFGAEPNTQCCPVCMGLPGALPVLNRLIVEYAVKAGLATNCTIASRSKQDRKNYFYPDLPKAYQISQYDLPLCEHGYLNIETGSGAKRIGITRIHIEEDAGKLVHDDRLGTLVDMNRCGVPLIEIVTEPDLRSAEEVRAFLQKLRAILIYTGVSDCKMNKGEFRCDVNLSVRKKGESTLGVRTEIKNLNSFSFIISAIEYESKRQIDMLESGDPVIQETRRFDPATGKTYSMRTKENADDYRYFPDPDLAPIEVTGDMLRDWRASIPKLPDERKAEYVSQYGITAYDAEMIVSRIEVADLFERCAALTTHTKIVANLIITEVFRLLENDDAEVPFSPEQIASLAEMLGTGRINTGTAKQVLKEIAGTELDPETIVKERGLEQVSDIALLEKVVQEVLEENPKPANDYRSGKTAAIQALIGKAMAKTNGRGNAVIIGQLLKKQLS
ncbi:MAG: Asp-tRNA(Asn)/Glu-tRNA(Gln) amidotransferase subunit GatB [Clostridiales bacterium]|nr:Asp-tRNA(Asn)/Glu-tRNA(Gln) amidotransferase subunit GatB [Clostridiales bacterium]